MRTRRTRGDERAVRRRFAGSGLGDAKGACRQGHADGHQLDRAQPAHARRHRKGLLRRGEHRARRVRHWVERHAATRNDREAVRADVVASLDKGDLKGKKIGFTTPGSGTWALGNVYLKKAGLDPEKDVELVSLGGDNAVFYTALQSGRVDAIASFEPIGTKVIADSVGYYVLDAYAAGTAKEQLGSEKADALGLVTREDVIAAKPDLVKRMVNVQKKGLDFIRARPRAIRVIDEEFV